MMYEVKNSTRNNVAVAGRGLVMAPPTPTLHPFNRSRVG
jgi:hypothetical protein